MNAMPGRSALIETAAGPVPAAVAAATLAAAGGHGRGDESRAARSALQPHDGPHRGCSEGHCSRRRPAAGGADESCC